KKEVPVQVQDQVPVYLAEGLILERKTTKEETERLISKAILQERGRMQAHISSQIQNAIDNVIPSLVDASVHSYMLGHILHVHPDDPHDDAHPEGENSAKRQKTSEYEAYFWTDSYASDDDEIPTKQVTQDIMEEISLTIDEAKLKKMVDEMLRQRCTSGDEHQKEILVSPHPRKITPLVQSRQRDPKAPALSLMEEISLTNDEVEFLKLFEEEIEI
ncbi:hypothetical protein Tco_1373570, partial [Tanacetum coccineum]